jgi:PKHD-type hydroxylase
MINKFLYWGWAAELPPEHIEEVIAHFEGVRGDVIQNYGENALSATTVDGRQAGGAFGGKKPLPPNILPSSVVRAGTMDDYYIRDTDVTFDDTDRMYDIFRPFIHGANESAGWNYDWEFMEAIQYTRYEPGQFYGWHADTMNSGEAWLEYDNDNPDHRMLDKDNKPIVDEMATKDLGHVRYKPKGEYSANSKLVGKTRKLSLIATLTEQGKDYEGGDFYVDYGSHHEDPKGQFQAIGGMREAGTIVVMPSYVYHQVAPVTSGLRKSIVIWANGTPWR